jgi:hypothetical protein
MGYPSGSTNAVSIRTSEWASDKSFALRGKTFTVCKVLVANTEATLAIPTFNDVTGTARRPLKAVFSANCDFWANYDISIAAIPSADITDGTAPEFKPTVRLIDDVTTLHLMAPANCLVSILFFR